MQIVLDGNPCDADAASIAEAIAAGAERATDAGRRIIEVYVDGERLSDDDIDEPDVLAGSADEVRLISADPNLMVRETLHEAGQALDEIGRLQQQAAEMIQTSDLASAMTPLSEAFDLWMMVQEATVKGAAFAEVGLSDFVVGKKPLSEIAEGLNEHLKNLVEALRGRDEVAISDILLYELPATTDEWKQVVRAIAEATSRPRGA